jgi:hypothetical protein
MVKAAMLSIYRVGDFSWTVPSKDESLYQVLVDLTDHGEGVKFSTSKAHKFVQELGVLVTFKTSPV